MYLLCAGFASSQHLPGTEVDFAEYVEQCDSALQRFRDDDVTTQQRTRSTGGCGSSGRYSRCDKPSLQRRVFNNDDEISRMRCGRLSTLDLRCRVASLDVGPYHRRADAGRRGIRSLSHLSSIVTPKTNCGMIQVLLVEARSKQHLLKTAHQRLSFSRSRPAGSRLANHSSLDSTKDRYG